MGIRILKAFSKREYAEQFLDGMLYMNTLAYFRWEGTDDQRDPLEGASGFVLPESLRILPENVLNVQAHEAAILPAGLSYANICCFFMQRATPVKGGTQIESPHDPSRLGEFYIAIDDFQKFIDRVERAAELHRLHYYCAPISYWDIAPINGHEKNSHSILMVNDEPFDAETLFPEGTPEFPHDVFCKGRKYASQMEWRIALCRGVKDPCAYTLRIGCLREIAHLVQPEELDADTRMCAGLPHAWITNPEGGNVTRKELFDKQCAVDPDRFYTGLSIG